jgi:hypothetical protein
LSWIASLSRTSDSEASTGFIPKSGKTGNDFEVDVVIHVPLSDAARGDDLGLTVDYSRVATGGRGDGGAFREAD